MNFWDLLSIGWRNIKGTFLGGFVDPMLFFYFTIPIWLIHMALLPLTLTIGAGIKTIVDFFTRVPLAPTVINAQTTLIKQYDSKMMEELVADISKYKPKSESSYELITNLKKLNKMDKSIDIFQTETKIDLAWKQSGDTTQSIFKKSYIKDLPLNLSNQKVLVGKCKEFEDQVKARRLKSQKTLIENYLNNDYNKGKKMQQLIGFFKPQSELHNEPNTILSSTLI